MSSAGGQTPPVLLFGKDADVSRIGVYPGRTGANGYAYELTAKHHGGGSSDDACWALDADEEFWVFNIADVNTVADARGRLYGVLPGKGMEIKIIGTWNQQIAEFQTPGNMPAGHPWHGYPIWCVSGSAPANRAGQHMRPDKAVFDQLVRVGLITESQKRRMKSGKHV